MSGIGLASGEMIHCSEPVIHEHPLLARYLSLKRDCGYWRPAAFGSSNSHLAKATLHHRIRSAYSALAPAALMTGAQRLISVVVYLPKVSG